MEKMISNQDASNEYFEFHNLHNELIFPGAVFIILLYSTYSYFWRSDKKKLPPGPRGIPILGYLPFLGKEPYKTINNLSKEYGNVIGFYLGPKYVVICNDWESKKDAFSKMAIANRPPGLFDVVPNGLGFAGSNGSVWTEQRRSSMKIIKDVGLGRPMWEEMLQDDVKDIIKFIEGYCGQPVDVPELFLSSFTSSIMTLLSGQRLPFNHPTTKHLGESLEVLMDELFPLSPSVFLPTLCSWLSKLRLYGSNKFIKRIREFSSYMDNAIKNHLQHQDNSNEFSFINLYHQEIEMNKKLNVKNSLTETSLYANSKTLLLGGSETIRTSMTWLLIAMAQYPEIQTKVHEELDNEIGREANIKWTERNKLPYTYACILESLRWRTLAPINAIRMALEDTEILGYHIPKGTIVTSNNWAIHNDPRYWTDPERFNPEPFLMDNGKQVNVKLDGYAPFSYGRRSCPGEHIGLVSMFQYFIKIMQKFTILPAEGKDVKYDVVIGLAFRAKDVQLRFNPR